MQIFNKGAKKSSFPCALIEGARLQTGNTRTTLLFVLDPSILKKYLPPPSIQSTPFPQTGSLKPGSNQCNVGHNRGGDVNQKSHSSSRPFVVFAYNGDY